MALGEKSRKLKQTSLAPDRHVSSISCATPMQALQLHTSSLFPSVPLSHTRYPPLQSHILYTRQIADPLFNRPARTKFRLWSEFESAFSSTPSSSFSLISLSSLSSFPFPFFSSPFTYSLTHAHILPRPSQTNQHGLQIHLGSDQSNQPLRLLLALPPALNEVDSSPSQLFLLSPCNHPF